MITGESTMNRLDNICRVYEPQILKTMGIAFDAAWDVLSKERTNRDSKRLELSRLISRYVDVGETDALRLCKLALDTFKQLDVQRAKKDTQSDLAAWIGLRSPPGRKKQSERAQGLFLWANNFRRASPGCSG